MELKLDRSIPYALSLEGGGAKGSYQIGAWRALREAGIRINAVAGTSVGALNGALIAMGDLEQAEEIWENIRFSQVMDVDDDFMRALLRGDLRHLDLREALENAVEVIRNRGFDVTPLYNWIKASVSEKAVRESDTELYIVTYSLSEAKELELCARDLPDGELWNMLLASAYLPVFRNEKLGGKRYADGGLRDVLPLHVLIENGYKNILALRLFGVGVERPVRIPRSTRVYTVEPKADLGSTLDFEPEQSRRNLRCGYYDTMRFLYGLKGTKYYIDSQWDELRACTWLLECAAGEELSLRETHEKLLPALAKKLNAVNGDFTDLAAALLDWQADCAGIDPWRIYTEDELLAAVREKGEVPVLPEGLLPKKPRAALSLPRRNRGFLRRADAPEEKLNICLLNDSFPPVIDGVANAVLNYARILTETEDGCVVATPEYPGVKDDYPFPVVRYPSLDTTRMAGYRAGVPFAPHTVAKLAETEPDIIHSHCPISSTLLARSLRETVQAPLIFTYHTKFDIDIAGALRGELLQETAVKLLVNNISACDDVWVVSRGAGENLRSLGYTGEYTVMPNGVDLPRGRVRQSAEDALSDRWGLPADVPVYLFVGRMMWYKGLRLLLDGLKILAESGQDFRMVFVGDGQDRAAVEAYAGELGLGGKCRFVGAEHDREIIRAWYCRADLLLFPSTFDTNGLVVREAAACSLGSLLIRGSCAAEGVEDGETGILIDETPEALAAALTALRRDAMKRLGARAAAVLYLSWEESVKAARTRYRVVLDEWDSGELRRRRNRLDGLFDLSGDVVEWMESAKRQRQDAAAQLSAELEKARERLDRYL